VPPRTGRDVSVPHIFNSSEAVDGMLILHLQWCVIEK
jgi:hypothetical protein